MPGMPASPAGGPTGQRRRSPDMFARGPDLDGPWVRQQPQTLYCARRSADAEAAGS